MSVICPKDGKYCCDDICNGGMCARTGREPFIRCHECGQTVLYDQPCDCDMDPDLEYDDGNWGPDYIDEWLDDEVS